MPKKVAESPKQVSLAPRTPWGDGKGRRTLYLTSTAMDILSKISKIYDTNNSDIIECLVRYARINLSEYGTIYENVVNYTLEHGSQCIPAEREEAVSRALGAYLRARLFRSGVQDFSAIDEMCNQCPTFRMLFLDQPVPGEKLMEDLPLLGKMMGVSASQLWEVCLEGILN